MRRVLLAVADWLDRKRNEAAADVIRRELENEPWPREDFYIRMQQKTGLDRAEVIHITNHHLIYGRRTRHPSAGKRL